jgi:hypothetical protein
MYTIGHQEPKMGVPIRRFHGCLPREDLGRRPITKVVRRDPPGKLNGDFLQEYKHPQIYTPSPHRRSPPMASARKRKSGPTSLARSLSRPAVTNKYRLERNGRWSRHMALEHNPGDAISR